MRRGSLRDRHGMLRSGARGRSFSSRRRPQRASDESCRSPKSRGDFFTAGGVAAGVAAAYRTPLAATLFVVEIIIGRLNVRVLGAAATSAFVAVITRDIVFGTDEALYAVGSLEPFRIRSLGEILGWGGLGLRHGRRRGGVPTRAARRHVDVLETRRSGADQDVARRSVRRMDRFPLAGDLRQRLRRLPGAWRSAKPRSASTSTRDGRSRALSEPSSF
jgi:hypothetical protein